MRKEVGHCGREATNPLQTAWKLLMWLNSVSKLLFSFVSSSENWVLHSTLARRAAVRIQGIRGSASGVLHPKCSINVT